MDDGTGVDEGDELAEAVELVETADGSLEVEVELDDFLDDSGEDRGDGSGEDLSGGTDGDTDSGTDELPDGTGGEDLVVVEGDDGRVTYDATPWAAETRTMLTSLLQAEGVAHVWQGAEVTVHESDEDLVDRLVTEVLAAAAPALDPGAPKVVYGVGEWSAALQTDLADALVAAGVPFEWDAAGDLVVHADDEDRVEELLDALPEPDEDGDGTGGADDGLVVHEVLDRIFVSADRLARRPTDARATVDAVAAAEELGRMGLPFGFEDGAWDRLVEQSAALAAALSGGTVPPADDEDRTTDDHEVATDEDEVASDTDGGPSVEHEALSDDERIAELAGRLRQLVAQYV